MKLSVVTVALNAESYLRETISSIADQQDVSVEHIVIDGGSSDGTARLLARSNSVSRYISEPDSGIYHAMNKGLRLCTGAAIGFLNAGDVLASPHTLSHIAGCFRQEGIWMAYGDLVYVDARKPGNIIRHWKAGLTSALQLRLGWMAPHPTFYVRREIVELLGGFDDSYRVAGDYEIMVRYLRDNISRAHYLPEVIARMRTGGISNGSLGGIWRKSREDLRTIHRHRLGGVGTLTAKNLRKVLQFIPRA